MKQNPPAIPGFTILRELGSGGSATVYLAQNTEGKLMALKVLNSSQAMGSKEAKRRLLGELKAANSPTTNIVRVHDLIDAEGQPVLVMDYVDGKSLTEFQSRLPYVLPEISVLIAIEILKNLEEVHERTIIHRDLKPSNILVDQTGNIFITDFGLAKWNDASTYTMHGVILGSPDYMSPEQAQGDIVTESSDLFSVTSILYFLITGTRPFTKPSPLAVLAAVIKGEFEPAHRRNPKISPALSKIIQKGLSQNPKDRFISASEYRKTLENYLVGIGLDQERFQFKNWLIDSSEETICALQTIAESLGKKTRLAIQQKNWDLALENVSHLSAVAPDSLVLERFIEEIDQQRNKKSGIYWYAAAAAAAVAVFLVVGFQLSRNKNAVQQDIVSTRNSAPETAPTLPVPVVPVANAKIKIPSKPKITTPKTQSISFDIPEGISVEWDGKSIDAKKTIRAIPGVYQVVLKKPGFSPIRQMVEVKSSEPTVIKVN